MGMFDFASDILGAYTSHREAEMSRDWNETEAAKKREWDERMANTQYQRTVQDLNAAGLSPMLAYSKGATSLPGGATASGSAVGQGLKLGETESRTSQSALAREQAKLTGEQIETAKSQTLLNQSNALKAQTEAYNIAAQTSQYYGLSSAQIQELKDRAAQHGASASQLKSLEDQIRQMINIKKPEERFATEEPEKAKWMNPIRDALKTIFEGVGLMRGTAAMPNVTKVQRAR